MLVSHVIRIIAQLDSSNGEPLQRQVNDNSTLTFEALSIQIHATHNHAFAYIIPLCEVGVKSQAQLTGD